MKFIREFVKSVFGVAISVMMGYAVYRLLKKRKEEKVLWTEANTGDFDKGVNTY